MQQFKFVFSLCSLFLLTSCPGFNQAEVSMEGAISAKEKTQNGSGITISSNDTSLVHQTVAEQAVAISNDKTKLYMSGGYTSFDYKGSSKIYSFNGSAWKEEAISPYKLFNHSMIFNAQGDKLFLMGGFENSIGNTNKVFYYKLATGKFYQAPSMVNKRTFHKTARLPEGNIVNIGGSSGSAVDNPGTFEVMNENYTWSKYNLIEPRNGYYQYFGVEETSIGIVVIGGNNLVNSTPKVERIYMDTDGSIKTEALADLNVPRNGLATTHLTLPNNAVVWGSLAGDEVIFACGGKDNLGGTLPDGTSANSSCEIYSVTDGGNWTVFDVNLGEDRYSSHMGKIGNNLIIGRGYNPSSTNLITISLIDKSITKSEMTADAGDGAFGIISTKAGNDIAVFLGGWGNNTCFDNCVETTEYVSADTKYLPHLSPSYNIPFPSFSGSSFNLSDTEIVFCGGYTADHVGIKKCTKYNTKSGLFSEFASLNYPRAMATITRLDDGTILAAGGESGWTGTKTLEFYNLEKNQWEDRGALISDSTVYFYPVIHNPFADIGGKNFNVCPGTTKSAWDVPWACQEFSDLDTRVTLADSGSAKMNLPSAVPYIPDLGQNLYTYSYGSDALFIGSDRSWLVDLEENWVAVGAPKNRTISNATAFVDDSSQKVYFLGGSSKSNNANCWDALNTYLGGADSYAKAVSLGTDESDRCDDKGVYDSFAANAIFDYGNMKWETIADQENPALWPEVIKLNSGKFLAYGGGQWSSTFVDSAASGGKMEMKLIVVQNVTYADWYFSEKSSAEIYDPATNTWASIPGDNFYSFLPSKAEDSSSAYLYGGFINMEFTPTNSFTEISKDLSY